jgi:hypothetical protein
VNKLAVNMSNKIIATSKSANDTRSGEPLSTTRSDRRIRARQVQLLHEVGGRTAISFASFESS